MWYNNIYMNTTTTKPIRLLAEVLVLGALFVANVALATGSASITALVTLQSVSVTTDVTSIDYGTLSTSDHKTTLSGGLNSPITATNAGNVAEDLTIKGQDSANWTIGASPASGVYAHKFCTASCGTDGAPGVGFTALSTSYATLVSNLAASGTQVFNLALYTPTVSAPVAAQSVDVTVLAAAH